jgi:LPXTG-motif cell wall-anchored protein
MPMLAFVTLSLGDSVPSLSTPSYAALIGVMLVGGGYVLRRKRR